MSKQSKVGTSRHVETLHNGIPCECGHPSAFWQGPRDGRRMYMCAQCYAVHRALEILQDGYIQRNSFRLGTLGMNDLDMAISYLKQTRNDND